MRRSFRSATARRKISTSFWHWLERRTVADGVRIDDLTYQAGIDLTNPTAGFNPNLTWSPETLNVGGNYTQASGATLQINLADPQHTDVLHVTGSASLSGTLNVTFALGAATPHIGDRFHVLDAGSISGSFTAIQLPALAGTLAWDSSQLYATGSLSIFSGLVGDFTQDGTLDGADISAELMALTDLSRFKTEHGLSDFALLAFGDVNRDGAITNADIQTLLDLVAAGGGGVAQVPEPATFMLAALGGLNLLFVAARFAKLIGRRSPFRT